MIEVMNYDGVMVSVMVNKIVSVTDYTKRGASCFIKLVGEDDGIYCTESRKDVQARVNKYLNDNK